MKEKKKWVCEEYLRLNKAICESSKNTKKFFFSYTVRLKELPKKIFEFFCQKNIQIFILTVQTCRNSVLEKKRFCFLDDSHIVLLSLKYSSQTPFFSFIFVSPVKWPRRNPHLSDRSTSPPPPPTSRHLIFDNQATSFLFPMPPTPPIFFSDGRYSARGFLLG